MIQEKIKWQKIILQMSINTTLSSQELYQRSVRRLRPLPLKSGIAGSPKARLGKGRLVKRLIKKNNIKKGMKMNTTTKSDQLVVKENDLFVCSWGYDQTNIDFYQVTGVTPSGKSVKLRQIETVIVGTNLSQQHELVRAGKGRFVGPERTYRLKESHHDGRPFVRITSYSDAYLSNWEATQYQTAWGFGH